jgi:hypothetical protein
VKPAQLIGATSAPGLGHIGAGTRPRLRRDWATSAPGLAVLVQMPALSATLRGRHRAAMYFLWYRPPLCPAIYL